MIEGPMAFWLHQHIFREVPGGVELIVNDPYPYEPAENVYTRNGAIQTAPYQYRIGMGTFSRQLYWHWSISNISFR